MKLFLLAVCVAVCSAGRLENTYLPPGSAATAGGNGNILGVPGQSHNGAGAFVGQSHDAHTPSVQANYRSNNNVHAAPQVPIVKFNNENNGDGGYRYEYETANGIQAQEGGQVKNAGSEHESIEVQGSYSYTAPDGVTYTVHYTADENGFHAQGNHLPTAPPIPDAILKSLQQNAGGSNHYQQPSSFDGQLRGVPQTPTFNPNTGYNY